MQETDLQDLPATETPPGVLFSSSADRSPDESIPEPEFFGDLNLDQVFASVTAGKTVYDLTPFFRIPLHDADEVVFRHEVMQDLERDRIFVAIKTFAAGMRQMHGNLARAQERNYQRQNERWFLDAVAVYCGAVARLTDDLIAEAPQSRGMLAIRAYLGAYVASERFTSLVAQTDGLKAELAAMRYEVLIEGPRVEVRPSAEEADYSAEVEAAFERFSQGSVADISFDFRDSLEMNQVEGKILDLVAKLFEDTFSELALYCTANQAFQDPVIASFDREIQFYVAYLEHMSPFKAAGLKFCYPRVSQADKEVFASEVFDLALAEKLIDSERVPVTNDFFLKGPERMIMVSGPNQGGKTTFARTFGQLHYLASLGLPVPGSRAHLYLPDRILTHFERQEHVADLRGKLEDDLLRVRAVLDAASPQSIVIVNEIFSSTSLQDAIDLSKKIATALTNLDLLGVWVTFIDEVASLNAKTVSMVSTVTPENPAIRNFKILRRPADGVAYAMSIAEKYGLTYDRIKERLEP